MMPSENFRLNGLDPKQHSFVAEDVFKWTPDVQVDAVIWLDPSSSPDSRQSPHANARRVCPAEAVPSVQRRWFDPGTWTAPHHVPRAVIPAMGAVAVRRGRQEDR